MEGTEHSTLRFQTDRSFPEVGRVRDQGSADVTRYAGSRLRVRTRRGLQGGTLDVLKSDVASNGSHPWRGIACVRPGADQKSS
jgi:hypothetical protein